MKLKLLSAIILNLFISQEVLANDNGPSSTSPASTQSAHNETSTSNDESTLKTAGIASVDTIILPSEAGQLSAYNKAMVSQYNQTIESFQQALTKASASTKPLTQNDIQSLKAKQLKAEAAKFLGKLATYDYKSNEALPAKQILDDFEKLKGALSPQNVSVSQIDDFTNSMQYKILSATAESASNLNNLQEIYAGNQITLDGFSPVILPSDEAYQDAGVADLVFEQYTKPDSKNPLAVILHDYNTQVQQALEGTKKITTTELSNLHLLENRAQAIETLIQPSVLAEAQSADSFKYTMALESNDDIKTAYGLIDSAEQQYKAILTQLASNELTTPTKIAAAKDNIVRAGRIATITSMSVFIAESLLNSRQPPEDLEPRVKGFQQKLTSNQEKLAINDPYKQPSYAAKLMVDFMAEQIAQSPDKATILYKNLAIAFPADQKAIFEQTANKIISDPNLSTENKTSLAEQLVSGIPDAAERAGYTQRFTIGITAQSLSKLQAALDNTNTQNMTAAVQEQFETYKATIAAMETYAIGLAQSDTLTAEVMTQFEQATQQIEALGTQWQKVSSRSSFWNNVLDIFNKGPANLDQQLRNSTTIPENVKQLMQLQQQESKLVYDFNSPFVDALPTDSAEASTAFNNYKTLSGKLTTMLQGAEQSLRTDPTASLTLPNAEFVTQLTTAKKVLENLVPLTESDNVTQKSLASKLLTLLAATEQGMNSVHSGDIETQQLATLDSLAVQLKNPKTNLASLSSQIDQAQAQWPTNAQRLAQLQQELTPITETGSPKTKALANDFLTLINNDSQVFTVEQLQELSALAQKLSAGPANPTQSENFRLNIRLGLTQLAAAQAEAGKSGDNSAVLQRQFKSQLIETLAALQAQSDSYSGGASGQDSTMAVNVSKYQQMVTALNSIGIVLGGMNGDAGILSPQDNSLYTLATQLANIDLSKPDASTQLTALLGQVPEGIKSVIELTALNPQLDSSLTNLSVSSDPADNATYQRLAELYKTLVKPMIVDAAQSAITQPGVDYFISQSLVEGDNSTQITQVEQLMSAVNAIKDPSSSAETLSSAKAMVNFLGLETEPKLVVGSSKMSSTPTFALLQERYSNTLVSLREKFTGADLPNPLLIAQIDSLVKVRNIMTALGSLPTTTDSSTVTRLLSLTGTIAKNLELEQADGSVLGSTQLTHIESLVVQLQKDPNSEIISKTITRLVDTYSQQLKGATPAKPAAPTVEPNDTSLSFTDMRTILNSAAFSAIDLNTQDITKGSLTKAITLYQKILLTLLVGDDAQRQLALQRIISYASAIKVPEKYAQLAKNLLKTLGVDGVAPDFNSLNSEQKGALFDFVQKETENITNIYPASETSSLKLLLNPEKTTELKALFSQGIELIDEPSDTTPLGAKTDAFKRSIANYNAAVEASLENDTPLDTVTLAQDIQQFGANIQYLSATDIQNLGSAVKYLSPSQVVSLGDLIKNFSTFQISLLSSEQLSALSLQLAELAPDQIKALLPSQIEKLTVAQINELNASQVKALSSKQLQNLSDEVLMALFKSSLNKLRAQQITELGDRISLLTPEQIQRLSITQIDALSPEQLGVVKNTRGISLIQNITTMNAAEIQGIDVKNLTFTQIQSLNESQIQAFTTSQISEFGDTQVTSFVAGQVIKLKYFTPEQLAAMSESQVSLIPSTKVHQLNLKGVASLVKYFSAYQISDLSTDQLKNLTPNNIAELTEAQIKGLTSQQITAMSDSQFQALTVTSLTSAQFESLSSAQIDNMTRKQINALADLNPPVTVIRGLDQLDANGIVKLGTKINDLTTAQIKELSPLQISSLNQEQLTQLGDKLKNLTATQVSALLPTQISTLSKEQLSGLTSISGWSEQQIQAVSDKIQYLTVNQLQSLGDNLRYLTTSQINALYDRDDTQFKTIKANIRAVMQSSPPPFKGVNPTLDTLSETIRQNLLASAIESGASEKIFNLQDVQNQIIEAALQQQNLTITDVVNLLNKNPSTDSVTSSFKTALTDYVAAQLANSSVPRSDNDVPVYTAAADAYDTLRKFALTLVANSDNSGAYLSMINTINLMQAQLADLQQYNNNTGFKASVRRFLGTIASWFNKGTVGTWNASQRDALQTLPQELQKMATIDGIDSLYTEITNLAPAASTTNSTGIDADYQTAYKLLMSSFTTSLENTMGSQQGGLVVSDSAVTLPDTAQMRLNLLTAAKAALANFQGLPEASGSELSVAMTSLSSLLNEASPSEATVEQAQDISNTAFLEKNGLSVLPLTATNLSEAAQDKIDATNDSANNMLDSLSKEDGLYTSISATRLPALQSQIAGANAQIAQANWSADPTDKKKAIYAQEVAKVLTFSLKDISAEPPESMSETLKAQYRTVYQAFKQQILELSNGVVPAGIELPSFDSPTPLTQGPLFVAGAALERFVQTSTGEVNGEISPEAFLREAYKSLGLSVPENLQPTLLDEIGTTKQAITDFINKTTNEEQERLATDLLNALPSLTQEDLTNLTKSNPTALATLQQTVQSIAKEIAGINIGEQDQIMRSLVDLKRQLTTAVSGLNLGQATTGNAALEQEVTQLGAAVGAERTQGGNSNTPESSLLNTLENISSDLQQIAPTITGVNADGIPLSDILSSDVQTLLQGVNDLHNATATEIEQEAQDVASRAAGIAGDLSKGASDDDASKLVNASVAADNEAQRQQAEITAATSGAGSIGDEVSEEMNTISGIDSTIKAASGLTSAEMSYDAEAFSALKTALLEAAGVLEQLPSEQLAEQISDGSKTMKDVLSSIQTSIASINSLATKASQGTLTQAELINAIEGQQQEVATNVLGQEQQINNTTVEKAAATLETDTQQSIAAEQSAESSANDGSGGDNSYARGDDDPEEPFDIGGDDQGPEGER
jgi:hypothetical protein